MKKRLKRSEKEEILRIVAEENALEGTHYGSPLDGDAFLTVPSENDPEKLSAFAAAFQLGETSGGLPVTEVMLFTDRESRRKGLATRILQKLRKPDTVLKFAEYPSLSGDGFLQKAGAGHLYDELCMTLSLTERKEESEVLSETVGDPADGCRRFYSGHSELYVNRSGETAYLFGVRTDRAHMGKGHAKSLLSAVLCKLSQEGVTEVTLQVSGRNLPALRLYEALGFTVSEKLGMWYL